MIIYLIKCQYLKLLINYNKFSFVIIGYFESLNSFNSYNCIYLNFKIKCKV